MWNTSGPLPPNVDPGHWVLPLVWVVRVLAISVVALRLYTRTITKHAAGWDDFCIAIAACLTIFGGINDSIRTEHGWGRHIEYLSPSDITFVQKWMLIGELSNFISLFFIRLSICIFVLRLLPITQRWSKTFAYVAIALNAISTIVNCVVFSTRCIPIQGIWDPTIGAKCLTLKQLAVPFWCASSLGVVVDFVVIIVPIFVIRNLQMNKRTKIGICLIMCMSFLTALCSIGKMVTTPHIKDPIYDTVPVFLFSVFEEECGMICASMPAMRQLYKHIMSKRAGHEQLPEGLDLSHPYSIGSGGSARNEKRRKNSIDVELNSLDEMDSR